MSHKKERIALFEGKEWEDFKTYATAKSTPEEEKELDDDIDYYMRHCKV